MARILAISMLASFVAGGSAVWLAAGWTDLSAPAAPLDPPLLPPSEPPGVAGNASDDSGAAISNATLSVPAVRDDATPPNVPDDAEPAESAERGNGTPPDPVRARMAAIIATAASDPRAAIQAALALPNAQARRTLVRQIAAAAARIDTDLGLELANTIDDSFLRMEYFRSLSLEWARIDARGFLANLPPLQATANSLLRLADATPLMDALRLASEADPLFAFELGERYPGARGQLVRAAALEALAVIDPAAAIARYPEFQGLAASALALQSIATGYARADLYAAVEWLPTIETNRGVAYRPVIDALALVDLPGAIELDAEAIELGFGGSNYGSLQWLANGLRSGNTDVVQVADLLWRSESRNLLAETLAWWIRDDPYGTVAWIHTKDTISARAVRRIAGDIGARDLTLALNLGEQFANPIRERWIGQALRQAAQFDPLAAYRWAQDHPETGIPDDVMATLCRAVESCSGQ